MSKLLQAIIDRYHANKDELAVQKRFYKIFSLERHRAHKARWHQTSLTLRKTLQILEQLRTPAADERWPPPPYQPPTTAGPPSYSTHIPTSPTLPPKTIPPHLLSSFPVSFTPARPYDHGACASANCPVREMHLAGLYYVDLKSDSVPWATEWFGNSEAPREVWDAVWRLVAGQSGEGAGQAEDMKIAKEFRDCHYYAFKDYGEPSYDTVVSQALQAWKDAVQASKERVKAEKNNKKK